MKANGKVIVRTKIQCSTCGETLRRRKTFFFMATEKDAAMKEVEEKVSVWQKSLQGQNCKVCQSIIDEE